MDAFVARAAALGLAEIGFTDHLVPRVCEEASTTEGYGLPGQDVARLRGRRAPGGGDATACASSLGVEIDYVPGAEAELEALLARERFDYVDRLGALRRRVRLRRDGAAATTRAGTTSTAVYRAYWETVAQRRGLGPLRRGRSPRPAEEVRPPAASAPMTAAEDAALEAIRDAGLAIELNTSGLRAAAREAYPGPSLLARAAAARHPARPSARTRTRPPTWAGTSTAPSRWRAPPATRRRCASRTAQRRRCRERRPAAGCSSSGTPAPRAATTGATCRGSSAPWAALGYEVDERADDGAGRRHRVRPAGGRRGLRRRLRDGRRRDRQRDRQRAGGERRAAGHRADGDRQRPRHGARHPPRPARRRARDREGARSRGSTSGSPGTATSPSWPASAWTRAPSPR